MKGRMTHSERNDFKVSVVTYCHWCHEQIIGDPIPDKWLHAQKCVFFKVLVDGLRDEIRLALKETTDEK